MKAFAYHNPDGEIRMQSSSGGLFSTLALRTLAEGGVVYGAAFDTNWEVRHIRVEDKVELHRLRGSKYVFSDFASTIPQVLTDLGAGRKVLFSGTPCQIAAVKKRAGENDNLLLVEVVCHGTPEPRYWAQYLTELCRKHNRTVENITSIDFRDKCTGWKEYSYTIAFSDGATISERHPDNLFFRAFLKNYTLREACFKCPFKYPNSKADIILGDFWGLHKMAPELDDNLGSTLGIVMNLQGEKAMTGISIDKELDTDSILTINASLTHSAQKPVDYTKFVEYAAQKGNNIHRAFKKFASLPWRTRMNIKIAKIIKSFK